MVGSDAPTFACRASIGTQRQTDALAGHQIDKTFTDKASGKDVKRPQLQAALDYLRDGDVLVCHSMDRLARNMRDLYNLIAELNGRGVAVEFVKERLSFSGEDAPVSCFWVSLARLLSSSVR